MFSSIYYCSWPAKAQDIKSSDNPVTFLRNPEQGIRKSLVLIPDVNYKSLTIPAILKPTMFPAYMNLQYFLKLLTLSTPSSSPTPVAGNEFLKHTTCYLSGISHFCLS